MRKYWGLLIEFKSIHELICSYDITNYLEKSSQLISIIERDLFSFSIDLNAIILIVKSVPEKDLQLPGKNHGNRRLVPEWVVLNFCDRCVVTKLYRVVSSFSMERIQINGICYPIG